VRRSVKKVVLLWDRLSSVRLFSRTIISAFAHCPELSPRSVRDQSDTDPHSFACRVSLDVFVSS
jgi:hypothetical protein